MKITPTGILVRRQYLVIGFTIEGKGGAWVRFNQVRVPIDWFRASDLEVLGMNWQRLVAREQNEADEPMF